MQPVAVNPEAERGYYVIWNAETWARMRVSAVAHMFCSFADAFAARAHPLLRGSRDLPRTPSRASFLGAKMRASGVFGLSSRPVVRVMMDDGRLFLPLYLLMLSDLCHTGGSSTGVFFLAKRTVQNQAKGPMDDFIFR